VRRSRWALLDSVPWSLVIILAAQATMSLRLMWTNSAFLHPAADQVAEGEDPRTDPQNITAGPGIRADQAQLGESGFSGGQS
jgi:hypothetical protein